MRPRTRARCIAAAVLLAAAFGTVAPTVSAAPGDVIDLAGPWQFRTSDSFNRVDSVAGWSDVVVPASWHDELPDYWGFAQYRRQLSLTAQFLNAPGFVLEVGDVREAAFYWMNGRLIGSAGYTVSSSCGPGAHSITVPRDVLVAGANVLDVTVFSGGRCGANAPSGLATGPVRLNAVSTTRESMPILLRSDRVGNIVSLGETITFTVTVHNTTADVRHITVGTHQTDVAPGASADVMMTATPMSFGPQSLSVAVADQEGTIKTLTTTYGAAPDVGQAFTSAPLGSNAAEPIAQMAAAGTPQLQHNRLGSRIGVNTMRYHLLPWRSVEQRPGLRNWALWDMVIDETTAAGLVPLLNPLGTPDWAGPLGSLNQPPSEDHWSAWTSFLGDAAERYAGRGIHWEIWNEEDTPLFWAPTDHARYAEFLELSAAAIRAADPNAVVVLGGLGAGHNSPAFAFSPSQPLPLAPTWTDGLMADGACPNFDVFNFHNYAPASSVDHANRAVAAERALTGCPRPMWVTEINEDASGPSDQNQPAKAMGRMLALLQAHGVSKVFHFYSIDYPGDIAWGAWTDKLEPRPVAFAQAALTATLAGTSAAGFVDGGVRYTGPAKTVTVLWDDDGRTIQVPAGGVLLDRFGNAVARPGEVASIGPETVYLVEAAATAPGLTGNMSAPLRRHSFRAPTAG